VKISRFSCALYVIHQQNCTPTGMNNSGEPGLTLTAANKQSFPRYGLRGFKIKKASQQLRKCPRRSGGGFSSDKHIFITSPLASKKHRVSLSPLPVGGESRSAL
jgi:hypothetical protein